MFERKCGEISPSKHTLFCLDEDIRFSSLKSFKIETETLKLNALNQIKECQSDMNAECSTTRRNLIQKQPPESHHEQQDSQIA